MNIDVNSIEIDYVFLVNKRIFSSGKSLRKLFCFTKRISLFNDGALSTRVTVGILRTQTISENEYRLNEKKISPKLLFQRNIVKTRDE